MAENRHFDVLIVVTAPDCSRLKNHYKRLVDNFKYGNICFIGSEEVRDVAFSCDAIKERVSWVDENNIIPFDDVHKLMGERLKPIIGNDKLPRGITGWYYQQFLKMQYSSICSDEFYMVWDGDTVPCRNINMFSAETGQPYLDLKHEYHPEYFETLKKILPGFGKVIQRSFISEHMLIRCDIMQVLISDIESNEKIAGKKFWEKILNSIEPDQIYNSAFSEFETYGTYCALRYPTVYKLRDWHSFRMGALFFDMNSICDRDFEWLGKDFDAISFEKNQQVREDHKNLFDNPEYQAKLSAKKMLQLAQMEFDEGYKEIWAEDIRDGKMVNVNTGDFQQTDARDKRVLIVIRNVGSEEMLSECLGNLEKVLNPGSYKAIVVKEDLGKGGCINRGVKEAGEEYRGCDVLCLNSDTILVFDALYNLKKALYSADDIGAVGSVSNFADNKQQLDIKFDNKEEYIKFGEKNNQPMNEALLERVTLSSFAMLIRRSVWDEVGGFSAELDGTGYEDEDLSVKILAAGKRLMLVRNSFVFRYENKDKPVDKKDTNTEEDAFIAKYGFDIKKYKFADVQEILKLRYEKTDRIAALFIGCGLGADMKAVRSLYPNCETVGVEENYKLCSIAKKTEEVFESIDELMEFYDDGYFNVILGDDSDG